MIEVVSKHHFKFKDSYAKVYIDLMSDLGIDNLRLQIYSINEKDIDGNTVFKFIAWERMSDQHMVKIDSFVTSEIDKEKHMHNMRVFLRRVKNY